MSCCLFVCNTNQIQNNSIDLKLKSWILWSFWYLGWWCLKVLGGTLVHVSVNIHICARLPLQTRLGLLFAADACRCGFVVQAKSVFFVADNISDIFWFYNCNFGVIVDGFYMFVASYLHICSCYMSFWTQYFLVVVRRFPDSAIFQHFAIIFLIIFSIWFTLSFSFIHHWSHVLSDSGIVGVAI